MKNAILMKGNEAIGEAMILAGARHYFGYPITPQTEISEYLARRLPEVDGVFVQAESETAAINMVYGASAAGARVMTSSSGPGISLKQEGLSSMAAGELPGVIVNISRGGPGVGTIQGAQSDYFQATRGGGHGDYHLLVLAPNSVQEMLDLTMLAFDLSDTYRTPVMLLGDGVLGQMMEPVFMPNKSKEHHTAKPWACTGCAGREPNRVTTLHLKTADCERHNRELQAKYARIAEHETRWEATQTEDADVVVVAFGISSRIALSAVHKAREEGMKAGLFRPITLWPFPSAPLAQLATEGKKFLVVEQNAGQMLDDVRLAVNGKSSVAFHGRMGGVLPQTNDIVSMLRDMAKRG